MNKIKISFDIENMWEESGIVRDILRDKSLNTEEFELFIITKSNNPDFIYTVTDYLNMDRSNVYILNTNTDIINQLNSLHIQIYVTDNVEVFNSVGTDGETKAILYNSIQDSYNAQPKWTTTLNFWLNRLISNDKKTDC